MNFRKLTVVFPIATLLFVAASAHARGGCVNSPENPTLILGLIGCAATCVASLRNKFDR